MYTKEEIYFMYYTYVVMLSNIKMQTQESIDPDFMLQYKMIPI